MTVCALHWLLVRSSSSVSMESLSFTRGARWWLPVREIFMFGSSDNYGGMKCIMIVERRRLLLVVVGTGFSWVFACKSALSKQLSPRDYLIELQTFHIVPIVIFWTIFCYSFLRWPKLDTYTILHTKENVAFLGRPKSCSLERVLGSMTSSLQYGIIQN